MSSGIKSAFSDVVIVKCPSDIPGGAETQAVVWGPEFITGKLEQERETFMSHYLSEFAACHKPWPISRS